VNDTRKRLDILFDHLNNDDLLKPDTVAQIVELSRAIEARDYTRASEIQLDVQVNKVESVWRECVNHGIVLLVVEELCFAEVVRMNSFVLQGLEHIFPMAAR